MNYSDIKRTCDNADATSEAVRRTLRIEALTDRAMSIAMAAVVASGAICGCSFAIITTIRIWKALICGG